MTEPYIVDDTEYRKRVGKLCFEMIKLARKDCQENKNGKYNRFAGEARLWLDDRNNTWFLSFQWCCMFLMTSPEKIRNGILRRIEKEN